MLTVPLCLLAVLLTAAARGQKETVAEKPRPPATITADTMEYDVQNARAYFTGNVHVIDDQMQLKADRMVLFFDAENQLQRVDAEGQVAAQYLDYRAKGGRAQYEVPAGRLVMVDKPVLFQATNTVRNAERVIYDRVKGKVWTEGGRPTIDFSLPKDSDKDFALFGNQSGQKDNK